MVTRATSCEISVMCLLFVLTVTLLAQLLVLRQLRFDWSIVAVVLLATVLEVDYLNYTSVSERNYDGSSHVAYVQLMTQHFRVPSRYDCGVCGHPPLYYGLAALWSKAVLFAGWIPLELGLAWLSLLLFFGFVVVSLLIFRSCELGPGASWLATTMVLFWPSSIINSIRVHNDALASLLMLAAMYFIARWDQTGRKRDFYAALTASALALLTKSSGYTVATTLVIFAGIRLFSTKSSSPALRRQAIRQCAEALLLLVGVGILAVGFRSSERATDLCRKVLGSACDGRHAPVADTLRKFVYFDIADFIRRMDSLPQDQNRDYFLNRFAKSSLFGVAPLGDEFETTRHQAIASALSIWLLLVAGLSACTFALRVHARTVHWKKYRTYFVTSLVMFLFLVAFRIKLPNEFHEDFRHIYPVLVPLCMGYALSVEYLGRGSRVRYWCGFGIGVSVVALSVAFFAR